MADKNENSTGFPEWLTYCIYIFVAVVLITLGLRLAGIVP